VFSRDAARARRIGARLEAGMTSINDFASTYMAQSLPFGGVKHSGFDRFAGVEGLRGCCVAKAVAEDVAGWAVRTDIPPPLRYPVPGYAFAFVEGLIRVRGRGFALLFCVCCVRRVLTRVCLGFQVFYGLSLWDRVKGVGGVVAAFVMPVRKAEAARAKAE
jgi:hypothetical protein